MAAEQSLYRAHAGFEAARSLPDAPLHGHSFKVVATAHTPSIHAALESTLADYDYTHLNDATPNTSDLAIAHRLMASLEHATTLHLQSAPDRGVYLDNRHSDDATDQAGMVWLSSRFEAAHFLPNVPEGHKCGRLHGHGFGVRLYARTTLCVLEQKWAALKACLNHRLLNDLEGLSNPTSEQLAQWIYRQLDMPELVQVTVQETHSAGCSFNGKEHQIWKQQNAESALYVPSQTAPIGHSYILRLYLSGDIDPTMGWAVDYSDVKRLFKPVYDLIDHHDLNSTLGVAPHENITALHLAQWIRRSLLPVLPELCGVDVFETDRQSVSYRWGGTCDDAGAEHPLGNDHIPLYLV